MARGIIIGANVAVLALAFTNGAGCSKGNLDSNYFDDIESFGLVVCECWNEAGFDSRAMCVAYYDYGAYGDCAVEILEQDPAATEAFDCYAAAVRDLEDCISTLSCAEIVRPEEPPVADCDATYDMSIDACPKAPMSVLQQISESCLPDFFCADGPEINGSLVCDGNDDCADGSDEQSCP